MGLKSVLKIIVIFLELLLMSVTGYILILRNWGPLPARTYIAHAGGEIDGHKYTNSLEAVENAISKGYTHIELDLRYTSDSVLVAVHDWTEFRAMCGYDISEEPLAYDEFKSSKIHRSLHPLDAHIIDSIFRTNPQLTLVTDKTDDINVLSENLPSVKGRCIVECFSDKSYSEIKNSRFAQPMRSGFGAPKRYLYYGNHRPTIMNEDSHRQINNTIQYFISTKILNTPISVYILKNGQNKGKIDRNLADSIMDNDNNVRFVYIDQL